MGTKTGTPKAGASGTRPARTRDNPGGADQYAAAMLEGNREARGAEPTPFYRGSVGEALDELATTIAAEGPSVRDRFEPVLFQLRRAVVNAFSGAARAATASGPRPASGVPLPDLPTGMATPIARAAFMLEAERRGFGLREAIQDRATDALELIGRRPETPEQMERAAAALRAWAEALEHGAFYAENLSRIEFARA